MNDQDPAAPAAKIRKERLAEALRANLLRRKAKHAANASKNSKNFDDQPTGEKPVDESGG